jgi:magnesium transporter
MQNNARYNNETVGSIMSVNIPTCLATDTHRSIFQQITGKNWDSIDTVFVLDHAKKLLGYIPMTTIIHSGQETPAVTIMQPVNTTLHPNADQEKAVFLAIKNDLVNIPVVDQNGIFLGAVSARKIIDVMHTEHLEDTLLTAGIHGHGSHIVTLISSRVGLVVSSRTPWLIIGLAAGLGLGLISSFFEKSLTETVALAYFIPVVAYIADSVGTQSEAIAVRALAVTKINIRLYLLKELAVGLMLGVIVGILGGIGAAFIARSFNIGIVVGLSLLAASTIASILASLIPITFKALGKDPALGSGPLATALQDVMSVLIYFIFAVILIR